MNKKLIIILSLNLILLSVLSYFTPLLFWDENAYLGNARSFVSEANYTENYRSPLVSWIIAGLWFFTGESIFFAKMIMVLFYVLTIYLFYLITKNYFKKNLLITLLFSLSSLMIYWAFRIYVDVLGVFFILLSFYLFTKNKIFFSGFIAGFAFLTKFPLIIFGISTILYLFNKKDFKKILNYSIGILLVLIFWMIFNYFSYNDIFYDLKLYHFVVNSYNKFMSPIIFIKDMFIVLHIFLLLSILNIKRLFKNDKFRIMLIFVLLYILYIGFISKVKFDRYLPVIISFIYIFAWDYIENLKNIKFKKILIKISIILTILLLIFTLFKIGKQFSCDKNNSISQTIDYLKNEKDIDVISNVWPWFGYYNNFRVHSFYSDINTLIKNHNPKYFIYSKGIGGPYDENEFKKFNLEKKFNGKCGDSIYIYTKSKDI